MYNYYHINLIRTNYLLVLVKILLLYIKAIGIDIESFVVKVDEYNSNRIYIKFSYHDFGEVAEYLRKDFTFQKGEVNFAINLDKEIK